MHRALQLIVTAKSNFADTLLRIQKYTTSKLLVL